MKISALKEQSELPNGSWSISLLFGCMLLSQCAGSGQDGVKGLHSSPHNACFGFVAKTALITQQCFSCR